MIQRLVIGGVKAVLFEFPLGYASKPQEFDTIVDRRGDLARRPRHQPVLDRYAVLLKYAYDYAVDRGARHWQRLEAARDLRDYYTHLDVTDPRSLTTSQVINFIEEVMVGIIWPSSAIRRTQLLGIYNMYWTWDALRGLAEEYIEQPMFKDWPIGDGQYMFHCPFDNVDASRFPNRCLRAGPLLITTTVLFIFICLTSLSMPTGIQTRCSTFGPKPQPSYCLSA